MLSLKSIALLQFKNYTNRSFSFEERLVGICGNNGVGKTNLLDGIHYLCFTKSYFSRTDSNNVQQGKNGFRIEGNFDISGATEKTICILRETGKKEFSVNGQAYDKFSLHIGRYPCVIIAPDDAVLITGGSEERRRFIDALLSQLDPEYLQHLINYVKVIQQRNSFLKSFIETGGRSGRRMGQDDDLSLLDVLDEQLVKPGDYIFSKRKEFVVSFLPQVKHLYNEIALQQEDLTLVYESQLLATSFVDLLKDSRQKDLYSGRTNAGVHRDDLELTLGNQAFRSIASQGQRKSLLFALKLAEMEVLRKEKGFSPLLMLDDVFEKLDENRISNLLQYVCLQNDGQVFITDTNEERLRMQLEQVGKEFQILKL
jgi:DNA replication and repair protein RecF